MCASDNFQKNTTHRLRKVGIYIDTKSPNRQVVLVMRFADGTTYWPFDPSDFINGYSMGRLQGFGELLKSKGSDVPQDALQALSEFAVTPCFVFSPTSNSKANRIKWAHRRKGNWGGKRPHAGRRPCQNEGQHDY